MNDYYTDLDEQQSYNGTGTHGQQTNEMGAPTFGPQNEEIFYSDRASTPDQATLDTYYSNSPYTRSQYLKSPDYKDKRMFIRLTGFCLALFMVIDFIRLYIWNIDFELDNELWLTIACFVFVGACEVIVQAYMYRSVAVVEIILVVLFASYINKQMLFFPPLGLIMLICSAYHVEQSIVFDQKWKHYQKINSD